MLARPKAPSLWFASYAVGTVVGTTVPDFHAVFETGGIEALVGFYVVQNRGAVFEPHCLVVFVFMFVAPVPTLAARARSSEVNSSGSTKQEECIFQISFTGRKTVAHWLDLLFVFFCASVLGPIPVDASASAAASYTEHEPELAHR